MKSYPYESSRERKKLILCEVCKEQKLGYRIEWQVDWFRGNDEYENICDDCLKSREEKGQKEHDAYVEKMTPIWRARAKKEEDFWTGMKAKLEEKYSVKYLTDHQWRINDTIDIYPTNRRYHNLKTQERGDYQDMHKFLARALTAQNNHFPSQEGDTK